jgi:prepilin-type N-terminal cleavage/methylation domain-containing protein
MPKRWGFTLIELPVVIAIVSLLISILAPALGRIKRQAKTTICLSNLHQWALARKMCADENKGLFVNTLGWIPWLEPFFKERKLLFCPEATKLRVLGGRNPFAARGQPLPEWAGSYRMNYWITKTPQAATTKDELMWKTPNTPKAAYAPLMIGCSERGACPHHEDSPPRWDGDA